mgnify:CR=1 FL=1
MQKAEERREDTTERKTAELDTKSQVRSVAKAFAVLSAFGDDLPSLTVTEIGARTDLDRGTAFRLAKTLVGLGYLEEKDKRYRLSLKCLELGFMALSRNGLATHAEPLLRALVPEFGDAASFGVLDGTDIVYVRRFQIPNPRPTLDRRTGSRNKAYSSAIGQALLAMLPPERQRRLLEATELIKFTPRTLTDVGEIMNRLDMIAQQGFAANDGEDGYGLRTIAVPVAGAEGQEGSAISLTVEAERMSMSDLLSSGLPRMLDIARQLERAQHLALGEMRR